MAISQFSKFLQEYIKLYKDHHSSVDIPNWDEYFLLAAILAATRSKDTQTQVGAVIVKDNMIVGTGYNSFPHSMPDQMLPNVRPEKYPWMVHAEINALANAHRDVRGCRMYCTCEPCNPCMITCHQFGIKDFVVINDSSAMLKNMDPKLIAQRDLFKQWANTTITKIKPKRIGLERFNSIFEKTTDDAGV